jgi:hypothetical protein
VPRSVMPNWFTIFTSRVKACLISRRVDADFDEELRAHLEMLTDDNRRRGMSPDVAARAARVRLGGMTQLKEQYRQRTGLPWFGSREIRTLVRERSPRLSAVRLLVGRVPTL